jgi:hypothetical protein
MHALERKVGGNKKFVTWRDANDGAIVTDAHCEVPRPWRHPVGVLPDGGDQRFFRKRQSGITLK